MILDYVNFIISNYVQIVEVAYQILSAIIALCLAMIALFMMIPGNQPEKALQSFVDFIQKFSRK